MEQTHFSKASAIVVFHYIWPGSSLVYLAQCVGLYAICMLGLSNGLTIVNADLSLLTYALG